MAGPGAERLTRRQWLKRFSACHVETSSRRSAWKPAPRGGPYTSEEDRIYLRYGPLAAGSGYVAPQVTLESGARSTGEPWEVRPVVCDAAEHLAGLVFPHVSSRVMRVERTFWEKATAIHVFCLQGHFRGDRFARHWHDLARLDESGYVAAALADRDVARAVARHKGLFFVEKDAEKRVID